MNSRTRTFSVLTIYATIFYLLEVEGVYLTPSVIYSDIIREVTITSSPSTDCSQVQSCQNDTTCSDEGLCGMTCSGRTNYPTMHIVSSNDFQLQRCVTDQIALGVPESASNDSTRILHFINDQLCSRELELPEDATISFWIIGSCSNCTFLTIRPTGSDDIIYRFSIIANKLFINDDAQDSTAVTSWVNVVIRIKANGGDVFINNSSKPLTVGISGVNKSVELGLKRELTGSDNLTLLDVRIYDDFLTNTEIKLLYMGKDDDLSDGDCRCPSSHPRMDGANCLGGSGSISSHIRGYYSINDAVSDGNISTKWKSNGSDNIVILIELYDIYQIVEVNVTMEGARPTEALVKIHSYDICTATITTGQVNFICDVASNTENTLSRSIASSLQLTLQGRQGPETDVGIIIPEISISGKCACSGNGESCIRPVNYQSYTCNCENNTNSNGQRCENCLPNFFMPVNENACSDRCICDVSGVKDTENMCLQDGTCICKESSIGDRCDECKDFYYNGTAGECVVCKCNIIGTESCNKTTGVCTCKTGVTGMLCDGCKVDYYNLTKSGCTTCMCNANRTENQNSSCHEITGQCYCKDNVHGRTCSECEDMYRDNDMFECTECNCNGFGSSSLICNKITGQCRCKDTDLSDLSDLQCIPRATMTPLYGPRSGGTLVTITGKHFITRPQVLINGQNQSIQSSNLVEIVYVTQMGESGTFKAELIWSDYNIILESFVFKPDPTRLQPKGQTITTLKSCGLRFSGEHLDSVSRPKIYFMSSSINITKECRVISDRSIICTVPDSLIVGETYTAELNLECPTCTSSITIDISVDPQVNTGLTIDFTSPFTKTITIIGSQFEKCEDDVKVYIHNIECKISSLSSTEIQCSPPSSLSSGNYEIQVQIGNFNFTAGKIIYTDFIDSTYFIYIMIGVAGVVLVIIIVVVVCCCRRRQKPKYSQDIALNIQHPARPNSYTDIDTKSSLVVDNPLFNEMDKYEEIKSNFLRRLQHGLRPDIEKLLLFDIEFKIGKVCLAKGDKVRILDGHLTQDGSKLTIKSLRQPLPDDEYPEWVFTALTECIRLRTIKNDNVLTIHGLGIANCKFHVLYPYMKNNTLKDHISNNKKEFSLKQLLECGIQVAEGMSYLSEQHIIHKDLAARNCMVNEKDTVKISDAAFSFDLYPTEYMKDATKNRYLPVRWMAPESIEFGFYDTKSDVWAFGVLLWELLTRGCLPFVDTQDDGIHDLIKEGYRLGKPELISDVLYAMVNTCWEENSEYRLTFEVIVENISNFMTENSEKPDDDIYVNWTEPRQSIYMNSESMKRKYVRPMPETR